MVLAPIPGHISVTGPEDAQNEFTLRMLPALITLLSDVLTRVALSFRVLTVSALAVFLSSGDPSKIVTSGAPLPVNVTDFDMALTAARLGQTEIANPALIGTCILPVFLFQCILIHTHTQPSIIACFSLAMTTFVASIVVCCVMSISNNCVDNWPIQS